MKLPFVLAIATLAASLGWGQGTLEYDQQSSTDETPPLYGEGEALQAFTLPYGQSFTPSLDAVGFIELKLDDPTAGFGGGMLWVNLISGSIAGPVMASTEPIDLIGGFAGTFDFIFSAPVQVTPGVQYFFVPEEALGGTVVNIIGGTDFPYAGGSLYNDGSNSGGYQYENWWFREGIIVPEPASTVLLLLGVGALALFRCVLRKSVPG
jgi:hypothetical protein